MFVIAKDNRKGFFMMLDKAEGGGGLRRFRPIPSCLGLGPVDAIFYNGLVHGADIVAIVNFLSATNPAPTLEGFREFLRQRKLPLGTALNLQPADSRGGLMIEITPYGLEAYVETSASAYAFGVPRDRKVVSWLLRNKVFSVAVVISSFTLALARRHPGKYRCYTGRSMGFEGLHLGQKTIAWLLSWVS